MIANLIVREGGFSDNPVDAGGPTNFGITQATARRHGYMGDMRALPRDLAAAMYRQDYVIAPGFDKIAAVSPAVAEELFDTAVNMGVRTPAPWLQRWLNAFNQGAKLGPDLTIDGSIGPDTVTALRAYIAWRGNAGEQTLINAFNCLKGAHYLAIIEANASQRAFAYGWISNRVRIT